MDDGINREMRLKFKNASVEVADHNALRRMIDPTTFEKLLVVRRHNGHVRSMTVNLKVNGVVEEWFVQFSMIIAGSPLMFLLTNAIEVKAANIMELRFAILEWKNPGSPYYEPPTAMQSLGSSVSNIELFLEDYSRIWPSIAMLMLSQGRAE